MELSQLQTIIQVAETGSISRASERLNIVQPALSRKLGNLEKELGVSLFERHGRGMVPTEIGRGVVTHALKIMAELESIRLLTSQDERPLKGEVTVGITPTIAEIVTVPIAQLVKATHPDLSVRFVSAFSGYLLDWLQRGEIDLALSYEEREIPSVHMHPVMLEDLLLIAPPHRFTSMDVSARFSSLMSERLVLPGPRHGLRKVLEACASRAGVELRPVMEVDSLGAMIALVRADFGCAILPLAPVHEFLQQKLVSFARVTDPEPKRTVVIAMSSIRPITPAARFLADTFSKVVQDMVAQNTWIGEILPNA